MPARNPWPALVADSVRLWAQANAVMTLRMWRLMNGGAPASREAERMVSEKIAASAEFATAIATGQAPTPARAARKAVTIAGRKVRANRKRLSR